MHITPFGLPKDKLSSALHVSNHPQLKHSLVCIIPKDYLRVGHLLWECRGNEQTIWGLGDITGGALRISELT